MFFAMLVAASAAITPAQSAAADMLAVKYLTSACADGNERYGVVTVGDGVMHDISLESTKYTVSLDEKAFRGLCTRGPLIAYHCHPTNDPLSLFPGLSEEDRSSDFATVAFLEFMCAEEGTAPVIEHRLVHTGDGSGTIVRFGLRGTSLERARGLGRQMAEVIPKETLLVDRYGIPDLSELIRAPARIRGIHEGLNDLYVAIHESYGRDVVRFLRKKCPTARNEDDVRACPEFSLPAFISAMEPCGDRYIGLPGAETSGCLPVTGERIGLGGPRYAGWTELTPETYDAFTVQGRVALAFCDDSPLATRSCGAVLAELGEKLPECGNLSRGYVDVSRHNQLRERHQVGFREAALLEGGRRYNITVERPSKQLFKLIVCGPESLFSGFTN